MQSFVCLYYGNAGSSWLTETLDQGRRVLVAGFEPVETWAWDAPRQEKLGWIRTAFSGPEAWEGEALERWLDALRASPQFTTHHGKTDLQAIGFKMTPGAIGDDEALLSLFEEHATRVIVLTRRNRIKHALSLYRYHVEGKSQFERPGAGATRLDLEAFDWWVRESARMHETLLAFAARCRERLPEERILDLEYEGFVSEEGKEETIRRVCRLLGVDPSSIARSRFTKATPDRLREAVDNHLALWWRYRFTEFGRHLRD